MIRIILAGQWRGNQNSWGSLKSFCDKHNAEIYTGFPINEAWNLPFRYNSVRTNLLTDTIFNTSTHPHKERYIHQWSALWGAYNFFNNKFEFADDDIVVKLRNDLVYEPFDLSPIENTIHVPSKEFHALPFPTDLLCNDQIIYGYNSAMKKYFNLPYEFKYEDRNPIAIQRYGEMLGIEETLRNYLYQQNIDLQTFELNYNKV